jgi:hypothetical protein
MALYVAPTGRQRAGIGAHRSNKYFIVFASSSFLEFVASVLSRESDSFDSSFQRGCDRLSLCPLFTTPSEH